MIYQKKYLVVKLLLQNVCEKEINGIYRPQAYLKGGGSYCTECQIEIWKKPIGPKDSLVLNAVLYAPHGFGDKLNQGSLLILRNGLEIEAEGVILEIIGYKN
jgi:hypothetical protein